ncbi:HSV2 [Candida metapsilosis]|uniref:HSV2 n=1 Tax=Candida metapsilosis TaxID=273372 RepID=A0A8H7ZJK4_9ASCO|nr:HSV2 [Candida metapsilosis]
MPSYKTNDNNHNSNKHIDSSDKINSPLQQLQTNSTKNKSSSTQVSSSPSFTNLRRSSPIPKDLSILCINFNQDHGCFAVGHELGFLVYNTDPIELRVKRNFSIGGNTPSRYNLNTSSTAATTSPLSGSGIGHITMLHRTNYLAVVGGGTNPRFPINKLVIWDDLKRKNSLSLEFDKPVLNVLLSRIKIVVILIDEIIVYSFASPPKKLITFETHRNEFGVADMSVTTSSTTGTTAAATERKPRAYSDTHTNDRLGPVPRGSHASISSAGSTASNASVGSGTSLNSILNHNNKNSNNVHQPSTILVFPGKAIGQIQIVDLAQQQPGSSVNIIKAHKSAIRNLCINKTGTMVASASVLGTLIRIHSTSTTQLLYEFRRGIDRADITSMKFSHDDSKLAVLSDKYTLHIFNLGEEEPEEETSPEHHHQENKHHALTKYINFLPSTLIPQYFKSTWSYCSVNTNQYHQQESELDTGSLGWVSDDEVVIVWQKKKIWEKYTIMEKSGGDGDEEYEIVRTSWKSLDSE